MSLERGENTESSIQEAALREALVDLLENPTRGRLIKPPANLELTPPGELGATAMEGKRDLNGELEEDTALMDIMRAIIRVPQEAREAGLPNWVGLKGTFWKDLDNKGPICSIQLDRIQGTKREGWDSVVVALRDDTGVRVVGITDQNGYMLVRHDINPVRGKFKAVIYDPTSDEIQKLRQIAGVNTDQPLVTYPNPPARIIYYKGHIAS